MANEGNLQSTVSRHNTELELLKLKVETITDSFSKLENLIQSMDNKLDDHNSVLLQKLNTQQSDGAVIVERLANQRTELTQLIAKVDRLESDVVKVRLTIAQKITYGALGGSVATGLIKLVEWITSANGG